jgi:hypothetical protein
VRSNPHAAELSDEELLCTGHFPANPAGAEIGASVAVPGNQGEKFTNSPAIPPPGFKAPEEPLLTPQVPRSSETPVNSSLLVPNSQTTPQPRQPTNNKHSHPRNNSPSAKALATPVSNPLRPPTVQDRLQPAKASQQKIAALVDSDDDAPAVDATAGGHTAAAPPAHSSGGGNARNPPSATSGIESEKKRHKHSRPQTSTADHQERVPDGSAPDSATPSILAMLTALTAQMQQQEKRLAAREQADEQAAKRQRPSELDLYREEQLLDEIQSLREEVKSKEEMAKEREQQQRNTLSAQPFAALQDPEYLCRFESLMKAGQRTMAEVAEALEATKERGTYSSGRADHYLKAKAMSRVQQALQTATGNLAETQEPIAEDSKLGNLLITPGNEDSVDIIVKLRDVHARARAKTAHCTTPALGAGNLVNTAVVKNDPNMGRKGLTFLSSVAYAVCEDCPKCTDLRKQAEKDREWKAKQAAKLEGIKKDKSKVAAKKRLVLPFKPTDSVLDKTMPKGFCAICKHGWHKGHFLYRCDECKAGIHLLCTDWHHLRLADGGSTWFACDPCLDARDRAIENGNASMEYVVVEEEFIDHELAPHSTEAAGGPVDPLPPSAPGDRATREDNVDLERRGSAIGGGNTPPPRSPHRDTAFPRMPSMMSPVDTPNRAGPETLLESSSGNHSRPSYQVKDYFTWELVPKDWAPKPDAPTKVHPEKGYSRVAYQNWRRKNVTLRDQVEANKSSLGPLTRGLSGEMRAFIGKQFLKEPALSGLWPHPVMSETALDAWVTSDPEYKWVEKIPDPILLELLDKRFGVKHADLFLSRKFDSNLPITDSYGEVNYHSDKFCRWAGEWSTELMELQKAGVTFEGVDLKQTLLNAVAPYKVIHDKAVRIATASAHVLLATLCDWVIDEEEKASSRRNQKESLLKDGAGGETATKAASHSGGGGAAARHHTQQHANNNSKASAVALMTNSGTPTHAPGDQSAGRAKKPLPANLRANGSKVFCRGCSNNWDGTVSIPCYNRCKFREHRDYFADCMTQEPPTRRSSLTWRGYRDRYPQGPFPPSCLKYEEWEKANGNKRPRDEKAT